MATHGPGRPWHTKIKAKDKRTVVVAVRVSKDDERRWRRVMKADGVERPKLGSYAYAAFVDQLNRDERRLGLDEGG